MIRRRITPNKDLQFGPRTKFIIGVDASLRNVGVSVIDNTCADIEAFNITTKAGTPDHASIDKIVEEFFERLERYFTPTLMKARAVAFFIEDINYTRHGDKTHSRAEAAGVLKWLIRQAGYNIYGIAPAGANSFLNARYGYAGKRIKSAEQKKQTMAILHRHCNFYTTNDNVADARVMALYGYAHLIENKRLSPKPLCKIAF